MRQTYTLLALGAVALSTRTAGAQGVTLDPYVAPMTADDGLALGRPRSLRHRELSVLGVLDFARDPLVIELRRGDSDSESRKLVQSELTLQTRFAFGLIDRLTVVGGLDMILAMKGQPFVEPVSQGALSPADGAGLGDARLGVRYIPLGDTSSLVSLAIQGQLTLPLAEATSAAQSLSGEKTVSFRPDLLLEVRPGRYRVNASLGALVREDGSLLGTRLGDLLTFGLGGAVQLPGRAELLQLLAELHGSTVFRDAFGREVTPLELLFGARAALREQWHLGGAAGPGLTRGVGSPDFRLLASLAFKTERVLERRGRRADRDDDHDGVFDSHDHCPGLPEDIDRFEDYNGCPDPDNDRDTVLDQVDRCPLEPEDLDGFEDDNGCPDR